MRRRLCIPRAVFCRTRSATAYHPACSTGICHSIHWPGVDQFVPPIVFSRVTPISPGEVAAEVRSATGSSTADDTADGCSASIVTAAPPPFLSVGGT